MRPGAFYFAQRVPFGACRYSERIALSPLRSRGGAASFSSCGRTRFHAVGRSRDSGAGAGSVSLRARAGSDRASAESPVSRCVGSREAGAHGDGTWHAADVGGFRRRETGRADFWKASRAQGAGIGRGNGQRAGDFSTAGSGDRTASGNEPLLGAGGRAGETVWRKGCRLG